METGATCGIFTLCSAWQFIQEFPCSEAQSHACFIAEGIQCVTQGICFLRTWLFLAWSGAARWRRTVPSSRDTGSGRPRVKCLGRAAFVRGGRCGSLYKGNSCSRYSSSYVIIWCARHLCTAHAPKTFILLICQYIPASHLSFALFLLLFLFISGRMHPSSQRIGFSPEIVVRQLLSYSTFLNGFIYIYIIYVFLKKEQAFWMQGQFQSI